MSLLSRFEKSISERGEVLKVGLVGAGQMGQGIVTQLSKTKGIELSLIIDRSQEKLEKANKKYIDKNNKIIFDKYAVF